MSNTSKLVGRKSAMHSPRSQAYNVYASKNMSSMNSSVGQNSKANGVLAQELAAINKIREK